MNKSSKQIISGTMIYFMVMTQVFGQAALLPDGKQQYLDNNGKPLAAGTVEYYVPGSLQKKTTWQNPTQTINNNNPVNLDIGGRGIMYGQGSYRQIVKDTVGNVIWDALTASFGSAAPSGATGTDTAPVGSLMAYAGSVLPINWDYASGQLYSRTGFPELFEAITSANTNIACTIGSTTLIGFVDSQQFKIGAPVEASCLPPSTVIVSQPTSTSIIVNNPAVSTSNVTARIFNWGNGNQTTTFNLPDLRGNTLVGSICMGFLVTANCTTNLSNVYYGAIPLPGAYGGIDHSSLTIANLAPFTPILNSYTPQGSVTSVSTLSTYVRTTGVFASLDPAHGAGSEGVFGDITSVVKSNVASQGNLVGTPISPTAQSLGSGTGSSRVQPSTAVNYIIKIKPNTSGAGGVVSIGGMFGDITCGPVLTCTNQEIRTDPTVLTNTLNANVALNNTALYFDGPSVSQGPIGTWSVSGSVTVYDNTVANGSQIICKLWDGVSTVPLASGVRVFTPIINGNGDTISLSGIATSPAGNLRISCQDSTSTNGIILSSPTDPTSTISAFRLK